MLAKFDGLDYHIYLSESSKELTGLKDSPLESTLLSFDETKNLGKRVVLQIGPNNNPEGAELKLDPSNNINIALNSLAYGTLESTKKLFTTYLKTENKLRIQVRPF